MEKTKQAIQEAYYLALTELPAHHQVCTLLAKILPKVGVTNVVEFTKRMKQKVAESSGGQVTTISDTARINDSGRPLIKWAPGNSIKKKTVLVESGLERKPMARGSVSLEEIEGFDPEEVEEVEELMDPEEADPEQSRPQRPQSGTAIVQPAVGEKDPIPLKYLAKKTASAIEAEYTREQIWATLIFVGITEPNESHTTRQLCAQLVKNLPK